MFQLVVDCGCGGGGHCDCCGEGVHGPCVVVMAQCGDGGGGGCGDNVYVPASGSYGCACCGHGGLCVPVPDSGSYGCCRNGVSVPGDGNYNCGGGFGDHSWWWL